MSRDTLKNRIVDYLEDKAKSSIKPEDFSEIGIAKALKVDTQKISECLSLLLKEDSPEIYMISTTSNIYLPNYEEKFPILKKLAESKNFSISPYISALVILIVLLLAANNWPTSILPTTTLANLTRMSNSSTTYIVQTSQISTIYKQGITTGLVYSFFAFLIGFYLLSRFFAWFKSYQIISEYNYEIAKNIIYLSIVFTIIYAIYVFFTKSVFDLSVLLLIIGLAVAIIAILETNKKKKSGRKKKE